MARARSVCFTLNNYTDDEIQQVHDVFEDVENRAQFGIRFAGYGTEVGEEGTPHLQGFMYFRNPKSFTVIHNFPGLSRAHFEAIKGTVDQNITYCSKGGNYEEFGDKPVQGKRTDIDAVVETIKAGAKVRRVADDHGAEFIKFHKGIERLIALQTQPRDFKTEVIWYYGPTGTGKSKLAFEIALAAESYYVKDPLNKWWDGYEQQDVVIVDDYRRDFSTFAGLLRLFDRYPMTIEAKGSTTQFNSKKIIITTPKSPSDTWEGRTEEELGQLLRRIDKTEAFYTIFNSQG